MDDTSQPAAALEDGHDMSEVPSAPEIRNDASQTVAAPEVPRNYPAHTGAAQEASNGTYQTVEAPEPRDDDSDPAPPATANVRQRRGVLCLIFQPCVPVFCKPRKWLGDRFA